jgi:hypothetical protein
VKSINIDNSGQALIVVMLFGIVMLILVMVLTSSTIKEINQNSQGYLGEASLNTSQSGIQEGLSTISSQYTSLGVPKSVTKSPTNCTGLPNNNLGSSINLETCSYSLSSNSLSDTNTISIPQGELLPINLDNYANGSNPLYISLSQSSQSKSQDTIELLLESSINAQTTCTLTINASSNIEITPNTNVLYIDPINSGVNVTYSSNPTPNITYQKNSLSCN